MSSMARYAVTAMAFVAVATLALWPFLDGAGRTGVLTAGAIAIPVQVVAFATLLRYRGHTNAFLAAWLGGTLVRMVVIGVVAIAVVRANMEGAVPMLLALAGFFFGLLLLEPVYFRPGPSETVEA